MTSRILTLLTALLLTTLPAAAVASACGAPATPIHAIQGTGEQSPMAGRTVTVEGILTRDARGQGGFSGFYLQQADHQTDNNPDTSEALFVYTRKPAGNPGQRLRITGEVKEYHGLTELVNVRQLNVCGRGQLPRARQLTLPWNQSPESLENMRVSLRQPLTVIEHYNVARYGELTLATSDQVMATEILPPGPRARAHQRRNLQNRLVLDDGKGQQNPVPVPWLHSHGDGTPLRAGDTVTGLRGVLDFRFGQWRLQPDARPEFRRSNPRPEPLAAPAPGSVRVMALNLENFFNGNGQGKGFPTPRGAGNNRELAAQTRRLHAAITQARPDILAITELENDGYGSNSAIAELTSALGRSWKFIATPGQDGSDAIRNALLYRQDRVQPAGKPYRLTGGGFRYQGRPPIAQAFRPADDQGLAVRVVVPHLKSKSCRNAQGPDTDQNDGQGCYNQRRTRSATTILDWLDALPDHRDVAGTLITGDLNSYAMEDPVETFRRAGYQSLVHRLHPCRPDHCPHHSYRYRGEKGSLDYALGSPSLLPRITRAITWNINADEARALGYNQSQALTGPQPWRASDHNPVITDINLVRN